MRKTEKEEKIIGEVKYLFNVELTVGSSNLRGDVVNSSLYAIAPENHFLEGSDYCFQEPSNLVHFTDLRALKKVISGKNIRLHNLHNLNDPREYSFAGNLMEFNSENLDDARDNLFLFSMCKSDILTKSKAAEFNMWRLYAKAKGIAMVLSFSENPVRKWNSYALSKVQYGTKSLKKFKSLKNFMKRFHKQQPYVVIDLGQLACFHKSELFKVENEVRLLFDKRKNRVVSNSTHTRNGEIRSPIIKQNGANNQGRFLELPIYSENFEEISNGIPVPKIERIILGYDFKDTFDKEALKLSELCKKHLGYIPIIEKSRLTKQYHKS